VTKTILIIEDSRDLREMFKVMLEDTARKVIVAADPIEALAQLETNCVDVVLVDYCLDHALTGADVIANIRSNNLWDNIAIVLMSAYDSAVENGYGADATLRKATDHNGINHSINQAETKRRAVLEASKLLAVA
jgi:CheY-like chemotaxis protein